MSRKTTKKVRRQHGTSDSKKLLGSEITPFGAISERWRVRTDTNWHQCKKCRHSYNDMQEGWNCNKYDAVIVLSGGSKMNWPGQACDRAFANDCKGQGFEKSNFAFIKAMPMFGQVIFLTVLASSIATMLTWLAYVLKT